jgi:hypothetical protein
MNLYFLEWGRHALAHGLRGFWDANFYFPARSVMTMSDHMIGPAVQAAAFRLVWNDGIAAYDLLFLSSYVLSGLACAWVLRRDGSSGAAAVLGGMMFAFSPYRAGQAAHLQVLLMQWIPLTLWWWDRLLAGPRLASAAWFVLFYALHVTGGNYLAYLIHFALAIFLLVHAREWRRLAAPRSLAVLAPSLLVCAALTLSLFVPYLAARRELGLERPASEVAFFAARASSYFAIEHQNQLWRKWRVLPRDRPESALFAGGVAMLFGAVGAWSMARGWWLARRRRGGLDATPPPQDRPASTWERGVLWSAAFYVLLSFAPVFLALARVVPGLSTMRVPTRDYPFVSLGLVVLAARGIDRALGRLAGSSQRWSSRRALSAIAIGAVLCLELDTSLRWTRFPDPPEQLGIFREISRRPEVRAVLHLPMTADARESHYMYYSIGDWKPIANGYSGFAPPIYTELHHRVENNELDEATVDRLIELGVTHVATHPYLLAAPQSRRRLERAQRRSIALPASRVRLIATAGRDGLYELLPRS